MTLEKSAVLKNLEKDFSGGIPAVVVYHVGFAAKERIIQRTLVPFPFVRLERKKGDRPRYRGPMHFRERL